MTYDSHDRRLHSYYMCDAPTKSSNSKATPLRHSEFAFSKHLPKIKVFVFLSVLSVFCSATTTIWEVNPTNLAFEGKRLQNSDQDWSFSAPFTHNIIPLSNDIFHRVVCSIRSRSKLPCYTIGRDLLKYANHNYPNQGPKQAPRIMYHRGHFVSSSFMPECSSHMRLKHVPTNVGLTCGKTCGELHFYFIFERERSLPYRFIFWRIQMHSIEFVFE